MIRAVLASLALALAPPARAGDDSAPPALKLPEKVTAQPSAITELKAETTGKRVMWVPLTPGLSLRPVDDGRTLLFAGGPGRYELLAYTALGDVPSEPARVLVVIEGDAPGPAPKPVDELRRRLAAALEADKPQRADVAQLAAVYREAARVAADPAVTTSAELLRRVRAVSASLLGADALPAVRGLAAEELLAALGMSGDEPLTEAQRKRASALYARLADGLEALNK